MLRDDDNFIRACLSACREPVVESLQDYCMLSSRRLAMIDDNDEEMSRRRWSRGADTTHSISCEGVMSAPSCRFVAVSELLRVCDTQSHCRCRAPRYYVAPSIPIRMSGQHQRQDRGKRPQKSSSLEVEKSDVLVVVLTTERGCRSASFKKDRAAHHSLRHAMRRCIVGTYPEPEAQVGRHKG